MIRRRVGSEFFLIQQHDHALLAGELARHAGNKLFDVPRVRRESFEKGVALHDSGWPLHDDHPTINGEGYPIDVFESTPEIALNVWSASSERALEGGDEYVAMLVSLHVLALSANAAGRPRQKHEHFDLEDAKTRFEVNRFQHAQIELQENLRRKLALPVDVAMRNGLVEDPTDPAEHLLQFHFRLLQALDQISLALCCTKPPSSEIKPVLVRPGGKSVTLAVRRDEPTTLRISPWLFSDETIRVGTEYRMLPAKKFADNAEFRRAYTSATAEKIEFLLLPA